MDCSDHTDLGPVLTRPHFQVEVAVPCESSECPGLDPAVQGSHFHHRISPDQTLREVVEDSYVPWTHPKHQMLWPLSPGVHTLWPLPRRSLKAGAGRAGQNCSPEEEFMSDFKVADARSTRKALLARKGTSYLLADA